MKKTCVICDTETSQLLLNQSFETLEPVCHDRLCEKQFYSQTSIAVNSEFYEE